MTEIANHYGPGGVLDVAHLTQDFLNQVRGSFRTGSRVICDTQRTDDDRVVLLRCGKLDALRMLPGWVGPGSLGEAPVSDIEFLSLRHPESVVNLILLTDSALYSKFYLATLVAAKLRLVEKNDRVLVFDAIMFDKYTPEKFPPAGV